MAFIDNVKVGDEIAIGTYWVSNWNYRFGKVDRMTPRKIIIESEGKLREFSRVTGKELKVAAWNTDSSLYDPADARRNIEMQRARREVQAELRAIKEELTKLAEYPLQDNSEDKLNTLVTRIAALRS